MAGSGPPRRREVERAMTQYFNAKQVLPPDIIEQVLGHLPLEQPARVLVYFHADYYGARDARVQRVFEHAVRGSEHRTLSELYEALGEEFGLSPRRIWTIIRRGRREPPVYEWRKHHPARPARSGLPRRAPATGRGHNGDPNTPGDVSDPMEERSTD